jgi:hypothetical protein
MKIQKVVMRGATESLLAKIKAVAAPPQIPGMASASAFEERMLSAFEQKIRAAKAEDVRALVLQAAHVCTLLSHVLEDGFGVEE